MFLCFDFSPKTRKTPLLHIFITIKKACYKAEWVDVEVIPIAVVLEFYRKIGRREIIRLSHFA